MRRFLELKINELTETEYDFSILSDEELKELYDEILNKVFDYLIDSSYKRGFADGCKN